MSIYTTEPSKGAKNRALNRAQCEAFDWMRDHGDTFPEMRDPTNKSTTKQTRSARNYDSNSE